MAERNGTKFELRRKRDGSGKWGRRNATLPLTRNGTKIENRWKRGGTALFGGLGTEQNLSFGGSVAERPPWA